MPRHASSDEVIAAIAQLAAAHERRTVFVGIDGYGASGKTTLAARVLAASPRVVVVHVDDFPPAPPQTEWNWDRFEEQVAAPLRQGVAARYQVWHWGEPDGAQWVQVAPGAVLVVEGVSSTRAQVQLPWDLTVWVDAPPEVRLARALDRDGAALMPTWLHEWMPTEQAYVQREQPQARVDLLVDGTALA